MQLMFFTEIFYSSALKEKLIMCLLSCWFKEWLNNIIRETITNLQDDHMALSFAIVSKGRVSNE
jgi:hypothetical protein